jgi:hypothetical protein
MKVFGAKLNDAQVEFFNEWDRYTRIAMSRAFDKLIWGDPRDGYHQFLFDDDGA